MNIIFYNRNDTKVHFFAEPIYLHPLLLLADQVKYCSISSFAAVTCHKPENFSDETIIKMHRDRYKDDEDAMKLHSKVDEMFPIAKKIKNTKHKLHHDIVALEAFDSIIRVFRSHTKQYWERVLKGIGMYETLPFIEDNVFEMEEGFFYTEESTEEDPYIAGISQTIVANESVLLLAPQVEKISRNSPVDYIKFPLWNFPQLQNLNYNKLKYTREELKPHLTGFKTQLKNFIGEISTLSFVKENFKEMEKLFCSRLTPFISPVQDAIGNSIYIKQSENQNQKGTGTKLYMGITSAENIVNFYEKLNVILTFAAEAMKEYLCRQIDIKKTYPFFYVEFNIPDTDWDEDEENKSQEFQPGKNTITDCNGKDKQD